MTILEAIKEAEEKQKNLGESTTKVYIRRKGWKNVVDPVDFAWMYTSKLPIHKTNVEFKSSKDDVINNDWELFYSLPEAENKDNKNSKPESTLIPRENVINVIKQIVLIKKELDILSEDTTKIKAMFEKNYGIKFDYFVKNPKILVNREDAVLYFFAELVTATIKDINAYLHEAIVEFDKTDSNKEENN